LTSEKKIIVGAVDFPASVLYRARSVLQYTGGFLLYTFIYGPFCHKLVGAKTILINSIKAAAKR
jgi:hypothetical protein